MNEAYIEGLQKRVLEIDGILKTKNLTPLMQEIFVNAKDRLTGEIERHAQEVLKQKLQIEADRQIEKDMGPLVGESSRERPSVRFPSQYGGAKTYGKEGSTVGIRQFHRNINDKRDTGIPPWRLGVKKKTTSL